jgi:hypothetical protein
MELEITVCTLDHQPVEISPCYKTLVEERGLEHADKWTDTVDVPLGKPKDDDS